jgi:hypothetical protein
LPLGGALLGGAIGVGGAIAKGVRARKQRKEAEKIDDTRPIMERTRASIEEEQNARQMAASTRVPGQSYMENQIGAQTSRATNAAMQTGGSTGEILNAITNVDQNSKNAYNDLGFQGAQLNQQNKQMLGSVLRNVSDEQKELFDYNTNQPFQSRSLKKQALLDASSRNTDNAISSLQDTAGNIGTAVGYNRALKGGSTSSLPSNTMDLGVDEGYKRSRKGFGVKAGQ